MLDVVVFSNRSSGVVEGEAGREVPEGPVVCSVLLGEVEGATDRVTVVSVGGGVVTDESFLGPVDCTDEVVEVDGVVVLEVTVCVGETDPVLGCVVTVEVLDDLGISRTVVVVVVVMVVGLVEVEIETGRVVVVIVVVEVVVEDVVRTGRVRTGARVVVVPLGLGGIGNCV